MGNKRRRALRKNNSGDTASGDGGARAKTLAGSQRKKVPPIAEKTEKRARTTSQFAILRGP